jgi:hypothetical protein
LIIIGIFSQINIKYNLKKFFLIISIVLVISLLITSVVIFRYDLNNYNKNKKNITGMFVKIGDDVVFTDKDIERACLNSFCSAIETSHCSTENSKYYCEYHFSATLNIDASKKYHTAIDSSYVNPDGELSKIMAFYVNDNYETYLILDKEIQNSKTNQITVVGRVYGNTKEEAINNAYYELVALVDFINNKSSQSG